MTLVATPGQSKPAAVTATKLYTASAAVALSVVACNQNTVQDFFRISKRLGGAADDPKQYLAYDMPINGNATYESNRITLDATDEVWVYSTNGDISFSAEGLSY